VWIDFEDAFRGPLGWDLACLVVPARVFGRDVERSEAALAAHGASVESAALDALVEARAVQLVAWTLALAPNVPAARERAPARIAWLREREQQASA
jgi:Ser/Thr protein kinase RdoA (MazF antagonist)